MVFSEALTLLPFLSSGYGAKMSCKREYFILEQHF